jgi:HEPN domain-containing protein
MTRSDFQRLAQVRIEEAGVLLGTGKWDGAYYLAGYAMECALKACIAKLTNQYDFPPAKKIVDDCYTHELTKLLKAAKLDAALATDQTIDPQLVANWDIAKSWSEAARYEHRTEIEARELYGAIDDPSHGVLTWIKQRW